MPVAKNRIQLPQMTPGIACGIAWLRYGRSGARPKVDRQAAIHANALAAEVERAIARRHANGSVISAHSDPAISTTQTRRNGHGPRTSSRLGFPGSESPMKPKLSPSGTLIALTAAM